MQSWLVGVSTTISVFTLVGCALPTVSRAPTQLEQTAYQCAGGQPLRVEFKPRQDLAIVSSGSRSTHLRRVPTGSGFKYTSEQLTIVGKGSDLTLIGKGKPPIHCVEQSAPGQSAQGQATKVQSDSADKKKGTVGAPRASVPGSDSESE